MSKITTFKGTNINDGVAYLAALENDSFMAPARTVMVEKEGERPSAGGKRLVEWTLPPLGIEIQGTNETAVKPRRVALKQLFDPGLDEVGALVVTDDDGGRPRFWEVSVDDFVPNPNSGAGQFIATLKVDGDTALRAVEPITVPFNISATGQTISIVNPGETDSYPFLTIQPTVAKTADNPYRNYVTIYWNANQEAGVYPVMFQIDTRVSEGFFASATGDDIRITANGKEVPFWVSGINTATTKIWLVLGFKADKQDTLKTSISAGAATEIEATGDLSQWPKTGIIEIDNEQFTYDGINVDLARFLNVSTGAKTTTEALHTAGATIRLIQHEIVISYGGSGMAAQTVDDTNKPIFDLDSTNTVWTYENFSDASNQRAGAWLPLVFENANIYTADHGGSSTGDYDEMGIEIDEIKSRPHDAYWQLFNPCGIVSVNFTNGEKYAGGSFNRWVARIRSTVNGSSYSDDYSIPAPTAAAWQTWSQNVTLITGAKYCLLTLGRVNLSPDVWRVEVDDAAVTLDSANTPTAVVGSRVGSYTLAAIITNQSTGEAIEVKQKMAVLEEIEIDTLTRTAIYKPDGSSIANNVRRLGGPRKHQLRLVSGENIIKFEDDDTAGVLMGIKYTPRYLE